jgi:hypothetical protein
VTPYERLLAEELPTGTFGHAQPPPPGPRPWTALEQAEHLAALETALDGWHWQDDPRHLRLIRQADAA